MIATLRAYERRAHNITMLVACLGYAGLVAVSYPDELHSASVIAQRAAPLLGILLLGRLLPSWVSKRGIPPQLPLEETWRFDEEGIEQSSRLDNSRLEWKVFCGWRETKEFMFLRLTSRVMNVLSKNAFASPQDLEMLHELRAHKLGPAK